MSKGRDLSSAGARNGCPACRRDQVSGELRGNISPPKGAFVRSFALTTVKPRITALAGSYGNLQPLSGWAKLGRTTMVRKRLPVRVGG